MLFCVQLVLSHPGPNLPQITKTVPIKGMGKCLMVTSPGWVIRVIIIINHVKYRYNLKHKLSFIIAGKEY